MGKRSNFERKARDFYPTPVEAVYPLVPHIKGNQYFVEPCAGDGSLVDHLVKEAGMYCYWSSDIEPKRRDVFKENALKITTPFRYCGLTITNPPWDRKILHPMIEHFRSCAPTWLLFDADWMHTKQSIPYMKYCQKIVSVGRIKWIPDSKMTGKDNCAWYLFGAHETKTEFVGRG
jgi:hypothetical protein